MSQYGLFPKVPTDLDLNGPILSFTTNPVGLATTSGSTITLTGIATVHLQLQQLLIMLELFHINGMRLVLVL